ncbi:hypothetical protein HPB50_010662 [Hyalomma asiaticum]|uniref:Uncharacterized protein n=1 Tax=Hyalomma asiaticum TaxID=266040 RepID=A0ACB7THX3_HYAAI|nr:hypothetical protein HPB50_010662 [Hyalomma asiaticum]
MRYTAAVCNAKRIMFRIFGEQLTPRAAGAERRLDLEKKLLGPSPLQPCHWKTKNATRTYTPTSLRKEE